MVESHLKKIPLGKEKMFGSEFEQVQQGGKIKRDKLPFRGPASRNESLTSLSWSGLASASPSCSCRRCAATGLSSNDGTTRAATSSTTSDETSGCRQRWRCLGKIFLTQRHPQLAMLLTRGLSSAFAPRYTIGQTAISTKEALNNAHFQYYSLHKMRSQLNRSHTTLIRSFKVSVNGTWVSNFQKR